jgi:hypothetical protein
MSLVSKAVPVMALVVLGLSACGGGDDGGSAGTMGDRLSL